MERDLRAHVEVLDSFSAHADRGDLLAFATACGSETRRFFLVHGEPPAQAALRSAMVAKGMDVHIPRQGDSVVLD